MIPPFAILAAIGLGVVLFRASGGPSIATADVKIAHASTARPMPARIEGVLRRVAARAGVRTLTVTSTVREPEDQARTMVHNVQTRGRDAELALYGEAGDEVVRLIDAQLQAGVPADAVRKAAADRIRALHAQGRIVSRHLRNRDYYAVDVAPSSLGGRTAQLVASAEADPEVRRVVGPPDDAAVHIEFRNHPAPAVA